MNELQDSPSRPSDINKLRTPIQLLNTQNIDSNDSVFINEEKIITW